MNGESCLLIFFINKAYNLHAAVTVLLMCVVPASAVNRRANVFTNILQPIHHLGDAELVQAEIHHR
jgi:hypothetical protein